MFASQAAVLFRLSVGCIFFDHVSKDSVFDAASHKTFYPLSFSLCTFSLGIVIKSSLPPTETRPDVETQISFPGAFLNFQSQPACHPQGARKFPTTTFITTHHHHPSPINNGQLQERTEPPGPRVRVQARRHVPYQSQGRKLLPGRQKGEKSKHVQGGKTGAECRWRYYQGGCVSE